MLWSERRGHELYVFWRGILIYKRWDYGQSVLLCAYGVPRRFSECKT